MRNQWRNEEDARNRPESRQRPSDKSDKFDRRPRSPPPARPAHSSERHQGRGIIGTESYRPSRERARSREARKNKHRRVSPSPSIPTKPKRPELKPSQPLEERITHPPDQPATNPRKRQRTRSPSPTRSDRYIPSPRRNNSRSRDRGDRRERRIVGTDRAFHPAELHPFDLLDQNVEQQLQVLTPTYPLIENAADLELLHLGIEEAGIHARLDEHPRHVLLVVKGERTQIVSREILLAVLIGRGQLEVHRPGTHLGPGQRCIQLKKSSPSWTILIDLPLPLLGRRLTSNKAAMIQWMEDLQLVLATHLTII